ncbi:MAG: hypothetical protein J6I32_01880, partial [Bacteroidaceae bacterium]|nr:hypothetical protein [Bacteroidaceae bacterium]
FLSAITPGSHSVIIRNLSGMCLFFRTLATAKIRTRDTGCQLFATFRTRKTSLLLIINIGEIIFFEKRFFNSLRARRWAKKAWNAFLLSAFLLILPAEKQKDVKKGNTCYKVC